NWDVPFPRALELGRRTGAQVLAALPLEPVVLGELARAQGIDPARVGLDTLFLGGAPVPPALQRRLGRVWDARVIELYGSTETMLLGTSCPAGTLHPETALAHCEVLPLDGADGRARRSHRGAKRPAARRARRGRAGRARHAARRGDAVTQPARLQAGRALRLAPAGAAHPERRRGHDRVAAADVGRGAALAPPHAPHGGAAAAARSRSGPGSGPLIYESDGAVPRGGRGGGGGAGAGRGPGRVREGPRAGRTRERGRGARRRGAGGAAALAPRLHGGAPRHRRGSAAGGQPPPRDVLAALSHERVRR